MSEVSEVEIRSELPEALAVPEVHDRLPSAEVEDKAAASGRAEMPPIAAVLKVELPGQAGLQPPHDLELAGSDEVDVGVKEEVQEEEDHPQDTQEVVQTVAEPEPPIASPPQPQSTLIDPAPAPAPAPPASKPLSLPASPALKFKPLPLPSSGSPPVSLLRAAAAPRSVSAVTSRAVTPAIVSRVVSDSGSLRTVSRNAGWHPTRAFDPPQRPPPKVVIETPPPPPDDNIPQTTGVTLNIGIPCIVLSGRRRFRANIKYLGLMPPSQGTWIGVEVDDLDRLGVETLPSGAVDGIRYFHFTPTTTPEDKARARKVALMDGSKGLGLGLGLSSRSASPYPAQDWTPPDQPRALFVRPSQVLFVLGAE